jgi:hypothetical protein
MLLYMGKVVWYRLVKPYSGRSIGNAQLLSIYGSIGLQIQWVLKLCYSIYSWAVL